MSSSAVQWTKDTKGEVEVQLVAVDTLYPFINSRMLREVNIPIKLVLPILNNKTLIVLVMVSVR